MEVSSTPKPTPKPLTLVTGANQGIGYAIAQLLASSHNFHIILGSRSMSNAESAIKKLQLDPAYPIDGASLTPMVIDITDDASIVAAAKFVSDRFGHLDILVNNAGISGETGPSSQFQSKRERYHAVLDTNVMGTVAVTDAFLPLLRASTYHDRRIVNVSTGLGQIGMAYLPGPYAVNVYPAPEYRTSKAALNMVTAIQAATLRDEGILAIAACPGFCQTEFTGGRGVHDAIDGAKRVVRAVTEGDPKEIYGTLVTPESPISKFGW